MNYLASPPTSRSLGASGLTISSLGGGTWRLADERRGVTETRKLLTAAIDAGINLIDTADIYGFNGKDGFGTVEELLGEAFKADRALRDQLVVATKGGILPPLPYNQSPSYLRSAIDASLQRLSIGTIDIYQIHRPDLLAHPQEVARVLDDAVSAGKVRALGISNYSVEQIEALGSYLTHPLVTTQPEISPVAIDCFGNGELDQAMRMSLTPLAWSPLAGGRLLAPKNEREVAVAEKLDAVAEQFGVDRSAVIYSWLMAHPAGIVPIIGSQNADRIAGSKAALSVRWTRQAWYEVFVAARGQAMP